MKQLKAVCICGRLYFRRENELQQPNGSIPLHIIKQYNTVPVGHYLGT